MNTKESIPSEIAEKIEQKRIVLLEEQKRKAEAERRQQEEAEMLGKLKFNEFLSGAVLKTPEWIRPYLDLTTPAPDYVRIAKGWDHVENMFLYFSIPGLAAIMFDHNTDQWRTQQADWSNRWDPEEPTLRFTGSSYWRSDIEFVLGEAEEQLKHYEEYLEQYAAAVEERKTQWQANEHIEKERETRDSEATLQRELKHKQEQSEEQELFDAIKHDPVAITLMKALVMINQERSTFTAQLEDASNSLYSMEEHWSRKAVELRHQADEAQRRAEEEKYRLQSDLDDAEARLKKAARGW